MELTLKTKLVFAIILIALVLRFYNAGELFFWQADEDILGLTIKKIIVDLKPVLLGLPIPGGIFIGPAVYYLLSIPYFLVSMDPQKLPYISAILSAISVVLVYQVGTRIFEKKEIGIMAAVIYGFSALVNVYSRVLTSLALVPILSLLTYWILHENIKSKKSKHLLILGLILAFSLQNEGSSLSLVVLAAVAWIVWRFKVQRVDFAKIIIIILISFTPMIIYDLGHNFFASKSNLLFFTSRQTILKNVEANLPVISVSSIEKSFQIFPRTFSRLLFMSGKADVSSQIMSCPDLVSQRLLLISPVIFTFAVFLLGFFMIKSLFAKNSPLGAKIVSVHLLVMFIGLIAFNIFFPNYFYEWTLAGFFPGFAFIGAYFLYNFYKKAHFRLAVAAFLFLFILYNVRSVASATNNFGLSTKAGAVQYAIAQTAGRPFYLESLGKCFNHGYLYLFWYFGRLPTQSIGTGEYFAPNLIPSPPETKPKVGVIFANIYEGEDEQFWQKVNFYQSKAGKVGDFGNIKVMILEGR